MPFLCWLMLTVTELNQSLTYIVIICTNVPHPSQSQINCLGMIYQKQVKYLTAVNHVGNNVNTKSGPIALPHTVYV